MQRRSFLAAISCVPTLASMTSAAHVMPHAASTGNPITPGRSIGIAMGGGSLHGFAHIGVLKAFAEKKIKFQFIAGTSAGAFVGALAAAQLPYGEIDAITRQIKWPGIFDLSLSGMGLVKNSNLRMLIDNALGDRQIERLPIAFGAIATDVATGARIVIRKGPAGAAVGASCAIPVLFEPVRIDGRDLVDGGLTEPVPVIAVREMGADIVIGVDVAYRPDEEKFQGLYGVAFQTMHIMANALIKAQIHHADVSIQMNLHALITNGNFQDQLVAAGYAATMRAWPKLAPLLA